MARPQPLRSTNQTAPEPEPEVRRGLSHTPWDHLAVPKKRPVSLTNMKYLSATMASQSFPDHRQNQTPPRGRHLKWATLIIRLTWVPNKMQPRHLLESLTLLSRGSGTLLTTTSEVQPPSISAHMEGGTDYKPQSTLDTKKKADSILFYLLSFLALRREWLPFHYEDAVPSAPKRFLNAN